MQCVEFDTCRVEIHSLCVEFNTRITHSQRNSLYLHAWCIVTLLLSSCFICPLLYCVSPAYNLAMLSSALAFIHLLSSSCTSYFYNISYMFVPIVNASVWWYNQLHSECILSDPGPIIIIIIVCILHVFTVFLVQLISLYFIMQLMSNHCI